MSLLFAALVLRGGFPTSTELLQRSQRAYDAVRTFEQDATGDISGKRGTAHISFLRPRHLRVIGKSIFDDKRYVFITDGKSTWIKNGGEYLSAKSPEIGMNILSGISANAGALAIVMLMHPSWSHIDQLVGRGERVVQEKAMGRRLLRVHGTTPLDITIWINPSSYFVVRTKTRLKERMVDVRFAPPRVNRPIPASQFRRQGVI